MHQNKTWLIIFNYNRTLFTCWPHPMAQNLWHLKHVVKHVIGCALDVEFYLQVLTLIKCKGVFLLHCDLDNHSFWMTCDLCSSAETRVLKFSVSNSTHTHLACILEYNCSKLPPNFLTNDGHTSHQKQNDANRLFGRETVHLSSYKHIKKILVTQM